MIEIVLLEHVVMCYCGMQSFVLFACILEYCLVCGV